MPQHVDASFSGKIKRTIIFGCLLPLTSCDSVNFDVYYNAEPLSEPVEPPLKNQRAQVIETLDILNTSDRYLKNGYVLLGTMQLESEKISNKALASFGAKKGASIVLTTSKLVGSLEKTYAVPVPSSSTTHYEGTIRSNELLSPTYNFSGSSTTTSTQWQQRSYTVGKYSMFSAFLAKKSS
ncbi:MAG: hypothetical protein LUG84_02730 [Akkermansiaceae bacterium]|nr:hypothetical protein [Akkermansiaceae bacterium]